MMKEYTGVRTSIWDGPPSYRFPHKDGDWHIDGDKERFYKSEEGEWVEHSRAYHDEKAIEWQLAQQGLG